MIMMMMMGGDKLGLFVKYLHNHHHHHRRVKYSCQFEEEKEEFL
jgi:hypothetical protein